MLELNASKSYNSDLDGCSLDSVLNVKLDLTEGAVGAALEIAEGIAGALQSLRCDGAGCLPIPWNHAFFAADNAIPGTPLLSFYPSYAPALGSPMLLPFMPSIDP